MLDLQAMRQIAERNLPAPLFVSVSGSHLYGFSSPDSDVDLRGAHLLPLREVVGLSHAGQTIEQKLDHHGQEVELVSHDLGKYLGLLIRNNGYVLEQIFSPLVVMGQEFLGRLRPLARRCITRHHYHHYRGFLASQRKLLAKQTPRLVKCTLYCFRVALTGIHLLRTGEVEASLPRLARLYQRPFLDDLIAAKLEEKIAVPDLNETFHDEQLAELEKELATAHEQSSLPEERDKEGANDFLIRYRLGEEMG